MTAVPIIGSSADGLPSKPAIAFNLKFALWTIFIFITSMAIRTVGTYPTQIAWMLADLAAVGLFFRYQSQFINIFLSNLVFVSWPLIACLSALWSIAPLLSFEHGVQLLMTMLVAFLMCIQLRLEQLITVVFWALLLAAGLTFVSELVSPSQIIGEPGWRGNFPHKNVMGSTMAILVVTACCLFLAGRQRLISFAAVLLGLFLIAKSSSAAAVLSLAATLGPLPFAYAYLRGRAFSLILTGTALVVAAVGGFGLYILMIAVGIDPVDIVLNSVGKDRTLTGRTMLWDMAEEAIENRPLLGFGFKAYWTDIPAEMRVLLSTVGGVFHFHNNYLDVAVAFGFIGPILLALGVITALWRSLRTLFFGTDAIDAWPLFIVLQATILTFVESLLFWNHNMWQVLFIAVAVVRR
jgi:O-antigen ligase